MSGAVPAGKPAPPLYFFNAPVDFLWVGGASLVTLAVLWCSGFTREVQLDSSKDNAHWLVLASWYLMWVVNWPHFAASSYRLYHTKTNIRQYPMTALVVPWVILALAIASFYSPAVIAPLFVKLFQVWSPYHFSGQTLGITLIYARRAGLKINGYERLALSSFIYGTFISMSILSEFGTGLISFWGVSYPRFGLPEWGRGYFAATGVLSQPFLALIPIVIMAAGGVAFLVMMIRRRVILGQRVPLILFMPAITQYVWFIFSAGWTSFNQFVPFFHSLQYMMIAWSMQMKEAMDSRGERPGLNFLTRETARWGGLILVGGLLLFHERFGLPAWGAKLFNVSIEVSLAIVLSAIQIHHFFVDGVIWKLKSTAVSSPLMMNVESLLHDRHEGMTDLSQTPIPGGAKVSIERDYARAGR
jgi:hypothetical protein